MNFAPSRLADLLGAVQQALEQLHMKDNTKQHHCAGMGDFEVGFGGGSGVSLGNITKSASAPMDKGLAAIRSARADRYRIQNEARLLMRRKGHQLGMKYPAKYHRTAQCLHTSLGSSVGVNSSIKHQKAFYTGLMVCAAIWTCPVCSAKIEERRRIEIAQAMSKAYGEGLKCIMVTFTFPHMIFDRLSDLFKKQAQALKFLKSGREWASIRHKSGYLGQIRSLELTHGDNGWHPHTHEIWIVNSDCDTKWLNFQVLKRWELACIKFGLLDDGKADYFRRYAVDVIDQAKCSDYLVKQDSTSYWGADRELAKASTKKSAGIHPFGLLSLSMNGNNEAPRLWIEYTEGTKGKRKLFWSKGLKEWAGLKDCTDEEIVKKEDDKADQLGLLNKENWQLIIKNDARSLILDIAELEGWNGIQRWLSLNS